MGEHAGLRSTDPKERAAAFEDLASEVFPVRGDEARIAAAYRLLSEEVLRAEKEGSASGPPPGAAEETIAAWALVFALRTFHVARELLTAFPAPQGPVVELGAGLGPFALAASLEASRTVTLVDLSEVALNGARKLFDGAGLAPPITRRADAWGLRLEGSAAVAAPFSLWEMSRQRPDPVERAARLVADWTHGLLAGGRVYLFEAGTRTSARFLQAVRDRLCERVAVLGPCRGALRCPRLSEPRDWCHFTWRMPLGPLGQRTAARARRHAHEIHVAWLVLASRSEQLSPSAYRVLDIRRSKQEVRAELCGPEGVLRLSALHRDRSAYASVSELVPGYLVDLDESSTTARHPGRRLRDAQGLRVLARLPALGDRDDARSDDKPDPSSDG